MCDSDNHQGFIADTSVTRRSVVLSMSSAAAVAALPGAALAANVVETDVMVPTADGKADAVLFHPAGRGSWPAVLMWPDILGLRPVFREMGRRLAGSGVYGPRPEPLLSDQARTDRDRSNRLQQARGSRQAVRPQRHADRREGRRRRGRVHHLSRPAEAGQSAQGRGRAGLLLQRALCVPYRRRPVGSNPRGRAPSTAAAW